MKSIANKIRKLISEGQETDAIKLLLNLNSKERNTIILLSARKNDVAKQIMQGIVSWGNANIEKNKIRLALLDIADMLEGESGSSILNPTKEDISATGRVISAENVFEKIDNHGTINFDQRKTN